MRHKPVNDYLALTVGIFCVLFRRCSGFFLCIEYAYDIIKSVVCINYLIHCLTSRMCVRSRGVPCGGFFCFSSFFNRMLKKLFGGDIREKVLNNADFFPPKVHSPRHFFGKSTRSNVEHICYVFFLHAVFRYFGFKIRVIRFIHYQNTVTSYSTSFR
nr:MAG TPA: hypothetical protein [Caudoviricetes sp.]